MPPPLPANAIETARGIRWDGEASTCEIIHPGASRYSKVSIARLTKQYPYFERLLRLAHQRDPWSLFEPFQKWLPVASKTDQYLIICGELITWPRWIGLTASPSEKASAVYDNISVRTDKSNIFTSPRDLDLNFPGASLIVTKCAKLFHSEDFDLATLVKALLVEPLSRLPRTDGSGKDVSTALDFAKGLGLDTAQTVLYVHTLLAPARGETMLLPDELSNFTTAT